LAHLTSATGSSPAPHVREAFGEAKYERLVALKDRYDPDNLFRHNQNIEPSRPIGKPALA
jgi:FAD/FMN-containing dehydrogenase